METDDNVIFYNYIIVTSYATGCIHDAYNDNVYILDLFTLRQLTIIMQNKFPNNARLNVSIQTYGPAWGAPTRTDHKARNALTLTSYSRFMHLCNRKLLGLKP